MSAPQQQAGARSPAAPAGAGRRPGARLTTGRAVLAVLLLGWVRLAAQPQPPRIAYVYPAGGQAGSSFQITVGGQYLGSVSNVCFSGDGVRCAVLDHARPLTPKEFTELRDALKELQARRQASTRDGRRRGAGAVRATGTNTWTAADDKRLAEIMKKLENPPNRQGNPALAEKVIVRVDLPDSAEPGTRELRLVGPQGLSNPLVFQVGTFPEFREPAVPRPDPAARRRQLRGDGSGPKPEAGQSSVMRVGLPATLNGQILQGEVDRFRFTAREGQRLVAKVQARGLIPYLPDAVPGWFQATIGLFDSAGREVAYADDFRFDPDPVLFFQIPKDGDYWVEVKDAIFRGREDFVYRVTLGELPFITSLFPLGARVGSEDRVWLRGWNLPGTGLLPATKTPGLQWLSIGSTGRVSNLVPFAVGALPECQEQEPNSDASTLEPMSLPRVVNGRIDRAGDRDLFRFVGRAGERFVAEVQARRLNSPLDSVLVLLDSVGRQVAFNDDHEDKGAGLTTHHADSRLLVTLPADGGYCVRITDAQQNGGPEYGYRLRMGPPQEDFALRVTPSALNLRAGGAAALTVYALRQDGFAGEIALELKSAPAGFLLSGGRIPAGQDQVRVTISAPPTFTDPPQRLVIEGTARMGNVRMAHPAVAADDRMQAFAYRHLVPAQALWVAPVGTPRPRGQIRLSNDAPVRLVPGQTATVRVRCPPRLLANDTVQLELSEPQDGVSIQAVTPLRDGAEIALRCDAAKTRMGVAGNLIIQAVAVSRGGKDKSATARRRAVLETLPAIPFVMGD